MSFHFYVLFFLETVEEAQKKLRAIMKQIYCYSTDNDDHAENKSKHCTKFFEEKAKGKSEDAIDKIMYDSEIIEARNSSNESNFSITCIYIYISHCFINYFKVSESSLWLSFFATYVFSLSFIIISVNTLILQLFIDC